MVLTKSIRAVMERLSRDGTMIAASDGATHDVRTPSITAEEGEALRGWVVREGAVRTIEIGLAYGFSALYICDALAAGGQAGARHVVLDPFQPTRFANCGLQTLEEAGVRDLVEYHEEMSQIALPAFVKEGRQFDFAFVDGNHRFDAVFLDLFYLGRLVRAGGAIMLDDYNLPGIKRAVSFYLTNLGWTVEQTSSATDRHEWVVLRTSSAPDTRDFRYFVEF